MTRREYMTQLYEDGKLEKWEIEEYYSEYELNSNTFYMPWVKNKNGHWCRFDKVMEMADTDVLEMIEEAEDNLPWKWTNQEYFENYAELHKTVYGEEFAPWVTDY